MWHEARKRERATKKLLNEHKKRAEKRREENRVDPISLLQVHGLKAELHLEPSLYKQANRSLVPWQGDKTITIDRFDVRATLNSIPKESSPNPKKKNLSSQTSTVLDADEDEITKKILKYERYRLLIQNDLNRLPEDLRLKLVAHNDVTSGAKIRKLQSNKFGTSGDASIIANQFYSSTNRVTQPIDEPKDPRRFATHGLYYGAVPPPASLNSDTVADLTDQSGDKVFGIVDLDDADINLNSEDLDCILLNNYDAKRLDEIVRKYGFDTEEFILLTERHDKDGGPNISDDVLMNLKRLIRKRNAEESNKNGNSQQIYGPALPPEIVKQSHPPSSSSSSNGSPVRQRSPSEAYIPLRSERLPGTNRSPSYNDYSNNERRGSKEGVRKDVGRFDSVITPSQPSTSDNVRPGDMKSEFKSNSAVKVIQENPMSRHYDARDSEREVSNADCSEHGERRASTPLLYKRNCRSDRSVSRERRLKKRNDRRSSHKSRRQRSPSRSRSRSSSGSYYSVSKISYSSSRSRKHPRRRGRSRERRRARR